MKSTYKFCGSSTATAKEQQKNHSPRRNDGTLEYKTESISNIHPHTGTTTSLANDTLRAFHDEESIRPKSSLQDSPVPTLVGCSSSLSSSSSFEEKENTNSGTSIIPTRYRGPPPTSSSLKASSVRVTHKSGKEDDSTNLRGISINVLTAMSTNTTTTTTESTRTTSLLTQPQGEPHEKQKKRRKLHQHRKLKPINISQLISDLEKDREVVDRRREELCDFQQRREYEIDQLKEKWEHELRIYRKKHPNQQKRHHKQQQQQELQLVAGGNDDGNDGEGEVIACGTTTLTKNTQWNEDDIDHKLRQNGGRELNNFRKKSVSCKRSESALWV